jgi:hypothetical protein
VKENTHGHLLERAEQITIDKLGQWRKQITDGIQMMTGRPSEIIATSLPFLA